ncbi:MAG TPA: choice-of-anchor J domain-containing protein [Phycisphaerae bacterium]|nr:choice-of-anchor J domain-containing protein [Phycisphaerae bacterium]
MIGLYATTVRAQSFSQNYESVCSGTLSNCPSLTGAGWVLNASTNLSNAPGQTGWFQGVAQDPPFFGSQSGTPASYIAANFANTGDNPGAMDTISNWMFAPARVFNNGDTISFWTRTVTFPSYADRLQLRVSLAGNGTSVGSSATDVGSYDLALDINPTYLLSGPGSYPTSWTQYVYTITGLVNPTLGRFAFRYFVENAGAGGIRSDYIGIDNVQYIAVPEPSVLALFTLPALLIRGRRRR